ncbi:unnamed protein product [Lactuca virosa]|uniref:Uncharacterized protein n=1 Tax=Lactuca virosa TaxID=75947 RepID=A0AAU9N1U7_9ASTR|nr:unnamed protein product [Lactuca virosa]
MHVKPVSSTHAFGFGTNENYLGPIGGASQSVHNSQPYFQDEGDFQPKQPEQPNVQTQILAAITTLNGLCDVFAQRVGKVEADISEIKQDIMAIKKVFLPSTSTTIPSSGAPPPPHPPPPSNDQ